MNILSNYPDIISVALFPLIIAVFVFALPLLLQTITRIDDKYNSTKLIETFRKDWICNWYIGILIASIVTCFFWCLQLPRICDFGCLNILIENSALILVSLSTIGLIVMTFLIVLLTYWYYLPKKLLEHLTKKHDKTKDKNKKTLYFEAISKLLFYSINKADEPLARKLLEFFYGVFISFRRGKEGEIIEYPQEYYDAVFEANELLCERRKKTISYFNDSTLFHLFLDEYQHTIISPKTYSFLWRLFIQALNYDKEDFIIAYWRKAHQLFNLFLKEIYPNTKYQDDKLITTTTEEIERRKKERETFLEFHYALGGLLMYKQKYEIIKEIMNYTQQEPPRYVLVPERMEEVIFRYMNISYEDYRNPWYYRANYPFPDINNINEDDIIRMWIKRYLAVLFLRQYTLHEYYTFSKTLQMPLPPTELPKMKHWNDELDNLSDYVDEYLKNKSILDKLELSELYQKGWFKNNNKEEPIDLINKLKAQIDNSFEKTKQNQEIDSEKEKEFKNETVKILKPTFEKFSNLFSNTQIGDDCKIHFIGGRYNILDKAAFVKNQEISYMNFDSIVAEGVNTEFQYYALNTFSLMFPQKYSFQDKDIFPAIDRLNLSSEKFVIIAIGLNLDYFSYPQIDGLRKTNEDWSYNDIEIIEINNYMNELVSQSLFIVKKEDLPYITFVEKNKGISDKYKLEKIDDEYNIYASLIDLNKAENIEIKNKIAKNGEQKDLSKSVLVCVDIKAEIRYKTHTCIQLKSFSQFDDRGTVGNIENVKSIWGDKK